MTEQKFNAVNLKATDYSENDKILTLFSYESGLLSARAKGVKKAGAKLKYAAQPFCFGEYIVCGGRGGSILCGCEYKELFYGIREDITKYYAACALAEYCNLFVQENQPERELFKLLIGCLNALCYNTVKAENILLHFLVNALCLTGYDIDFEKCCICGGIIEERAKANFAEGGFICGKCGGNGEGGALCKTMKFIAKNPLERLNTVTVSTEKVISALKYINTFIAETAGAKLKSLNEFTNKGHNV